MDLKTYERLTGIECGSNDKFMQAQLRRSQSMLETMLGFTLSPDLANTNIYNELGKTSRDCFCPSSVQNDDDLEPADEVIGAYRLFDYNPDDVFHAIDPFKVIHKAKLVYVRTGGGTDGITIRTFDNDQIRSHFGVGNFAKYIEHCKNCFCSCQCDTNCVQLAVDADWLWGENDQIPDDLLYVLADMVTYYSDQKRDIKSESITTHSYTKFDKIAPETEPSNMAVIKKYAGAHGSAVVMPV